MLTYIIFVCFFVFLIIGRIFLINKKNYKKISLINFVLLNLFTLFWFINQYVFSYREYKIIESDAPINIIPDILIYNLLIVSLCIIYNVLFLVLHFRFFHIEK